MAVAKRVRYGSHEDYLVSVPEHRDRLDLILNEVIERVPDAKPVISYNMPAYRRARIFFYVAAFRKHVGIYPPLTDDAALVAETTPYRGPKGNLAFPHDAPLPMDLIGRVVQALAAQYGGRGEVNVARPADGIR
jgi:uncharacterized protein YdhG (YjbR/CyaY superfamily)